MEKRFKVGETVIALTDPENARCQPRKKGQQYVVTAVSYCVGCGVQQVNIDSQSAPKPEVSCQCGRIQCNNGLELTRSEHFARPEELEAEMQSAVEEENYEHAAVLRDLINQ